MQGDAYSALEMTTNGLIFAGTNYSVAANVTGDGVVFTMYFDVPDDAVVGTFYEITWSDLLIYDIDGNLLIPTTIEVCI